MKIIHPNGLGGVAIIHPSAAIPSAALAQLARKDVPPGLPFRYLDPADLPPTKEFREAWEADFSAPHGYGIGAEAWFALGHGWEAAVDDAVSLPFALDFWTEAEAPPRPDGLTDDEEIARLAAFDALRALNIANLTAAIEALQ